MAVIIKDDEADILIRELAQRTGETITQAVKQSVRERLERVPMCEDGLMQTSSTSFFRNSASMSEG
jgi:antitoxin VapB